MREIPLTQGQVAIVDDEDYEWLSQFKWYAKWCPEIRGYRAAHNIFLPRTGKPGIEHVNGGWLDSRRGNIETGYQR